MIRNSHTVSVREHKDFAHEVPLRDPDRRYTADILSRFCGKNHRFQDMCSGISRYNGKNIKVYAMLLQKSGSTENALKHGFIPGSMAVNIIGFSDTV